MKFKFEMTPKRRLDASYWLATFQAIVMMTFFHDLTAGDATVAEWVALLVTWIVIGFLYIKNTMAFQKETLWMTIKNPAKVTREEGTDMFGMPLVRPTAPPPPGSRPPPPPPPPPRKF